ncbi:MAG: endonuclease MutS2 [Deltaproteobacteria bacterium]|nr:endonuclease MutS2 [Deltaproteobacteria bacterium]
MDSTTLETLEYGAVLKEIAAFASNPLGEARVFNTRPFASIQTIEETFREFKEVRDCVQEAGKLPLSGVVDLAPLFALVEPDGAYLLPEDLVVVKGNLEATVALKALITPAFERAYQRTAEKINSLSEVSFPLSEIERTLDERGDIRDNASTELRRIRKEIRAGRERARSIIERVSTDKKTREILQDDIITIRDDRYVLCIKASAHTAFDGIIHGRSISAQTYFIEPLELVELNNRVAVLKKEERAEEIEILKALTSVIKAHRDGILNDQAIAAGLDDLQAKALFGKETGAVIPAMKREGEIGLYGARHPLLVLKERRGGPPVVPVDIAIPGGCMALVISGANTGGKTVALKTLGLLTLMALSSIPVTADEGSVAIVFSGIFSDIGDRQDIIASLSTFSAHVKRLKGFLSEAGPGSLILVDEIGAGTDPSEGGALALAALETLRAQGAKTIVTTHLNLLKAHAQVDRAYLNASVEFDEKTLKPLYRLNYGVPGPSLGLSIAESLGIPHAVIELARKNIREKEGAFINSIRLLEEEKEEIRGLKERLSALEGRRNEAVKKLRGERALMLEKARARVETLVSEARRDMKEAMEKLREEGADRGRKSAQSRIEEISARALSRLRAPGKEIYAPAPGDKVAIDGSSSKGTVLSVDANARKAELSVGGLKVWVAFEKLVKRGGMERAKAAQGITINADMDVASTINVIGRRAEPALEAVAKFLDNAHANGLQMVEIIHGVGTGRLAKAIEEHLKGNGLVKGFSHGDSARGGAGVTLVELK